MKSKTPLTDATLIHSDGSLYELCKKFELENQTLRGLLAETCDFVNRHHDKKVLDQKSLALKLRLEKAAMKL